MGTPECRGTPAMSNLPSLNELKPSKRPNFLIESVKIASQSNKPETEFYVMHLNVSHNCISRLEQKQNELLKQTFERPQIPVVHNPVL